MAYSTEVATYNRPMMIPVPEAEYRYLKDRVYSAERELSDIKRREYEMRREYDYRYTRYYPFPQEYPSMWPTEKPKEPMNKLSVLARKMFDPATKKLIKSGVLHNDLTVKDEAFVMSFLVNKYKKELALEADKRTAEDKEEAV